jgi:hypothetical protein
MLDTLKLAKRLEAAHMEKEQAEALAEGLAESLKESYVSREYLDGRLARLEARLVGWMLAGFLVQSGLLWALLHHA